MLCLPCCLLDLFDVVVVKDGCSDGTIDGMGDDRRKAETSLGLSVCDESGRTYRQVIES
jgi:hypothetical protein